MPARLQTRMRPAERRRPRPDAATVFVGLSYSLSHLRGSADEQSLEHFPIRLRHLLRRHARACPAHPSIFVRRWIAGSSPAMTADRFMPRHAAAWLPSEIKTVGYRGRSLPEVLLVFAASEDSLLWFASLELIRE